MSICEMIAESRELASKKETRKVDSNLGKTRHTLFYNKTTGDASQVSE